MVRWSWVSPLLYVAACVVAVVVSPTNFLVVWLTVVIVYHVVLSQLGFVEVAPSGGRPDAGDGHLVLSLYRRAAPVLVIAGVLLFVIDVPYGSQLSGLLIGTGTALNLSVKTVTFAGTGV